MLQCQKRNTVPSETYRHSTRAPGTQTRKKRRGTPGEGFILQHQGQAQRPATHVPGQEMHREGGGSGASGEDILSWSRTTRGM